MDRQPFCNDLNIGELGDEAAGCARQEPVGRSQRAKTRTIRLLYDAAGETVRRNAID